MQWAGAVAEIDDWDIADLADVAIEFCELCDTPPLDADGQLCFCASAYVNVLKSIQANHAGRERIWQAFIQTLSHPVELPACKVLAAVKKSFLQEPLLSY